MNERATANHHERPDTGLHHIGTGRLAVPVAIGMLFQTLYFLVDL
jgi:hypothetical protein